MEEEAQMYLAQGDDWSLALLNVSFEILTQNLSLSYYASFSNAFKNILHNQNPRIKW